MTERSVTRTGLVKAAVLVSLAVAVMLTLIQFELPGLHSLLQMLSNRMVPKQVFLAGAGEEELLRQGWLYFNLGHYDEARRVMTEVAKADGNVSALYCLALIDLRHGEYAAAAQKLEKVAAVSPEHVPTRINLGKSYLHMYRYGKAAENLQKALAADPANHEARRLLAEAYLRLRQN